MYEIVIPTYRFKEENLLSMAQNGWKAYFDHLEDFNSFSPFYTRAFGEEQLQLVQDMIAEQVSAGKKKKEIIDSLKAQTILVCRHWQLLKRYIQGAYPKRFQASKLNTAGKEYYFDAYRYHFESVISLINESTIFLNSYQILLTLDNNMPLSFVDEYFAACDQFIRLNNKYNESKGAEKEIKYRKIKQLNKIYKMLAEMFNDGKAIFANDKEKRSLFVFRQQIKNEQL